ncbi:MAG: BlaI/MecI/CopY family transcriptional regulator [Acidobacteria bacterium]|nr:BlaI/MecI/CopY family transcriptional regulator [Acidobacteriota bacterium]
MRLLRFSLVPAGPSPVEARALGPLELEMLQRVWQSAEVTVAEVHGPVRDRLAYTTVMTTLDRLYKKGFLKRRKSGRAFYYSAAVSQAEFSALAARQALASMLTYAHPSTRDAVSYFVEALSDSDARLLDDLERAVKAQRKKGRR